MLVVKKTRTGATSNLAPSVKSSPSYMHVSDERAQNFSVSALSWWSWLSFERAQRGTRECGDADRITRAGCSDRRAVRRGCLAASTEMIESVAELEVRAGDGSERLVGSRRDDGAKVFECCI